MDNTFGYDHPNKIILLNNIGMIDYKLYNFDDAEMLFIDAEGFDDQVIYNSSIDKFNFNIIGYEFKGLNESKLKDLHNYLTKRNYKIFRWKKSDELAIKI